MLAFWIFLVVILVLALSRRVHGAGEDGASSNLAGAVRRYIAGTTPWAESEIEIRNLAGLNGSELPSEKAQYSVRQGSPPSSFRNLILPVEMKQEGVAGRTIWIMAQANVRARILQASRKLEYGKAISAEDIVEAETDLLNPRAVYFRSNDEAIGKVLRRTLSPGDPLTRDCIIEPLLVRSGATVRVSLKLGAIHLTTSARAEQNGRLGQLIRVRNLETARIVQALVAGRDEVRVE